MTNLTITERAAARLIQKTPLETNRDLEGLLMQRCRLSLKSNVRTTFHDNRTATEEYSPPTLVGKAVVENLPSVIKAFELAMTPAPNHEIVAAITKLKIKTASRQGEAIDFKFLIRVWSEDLKNYPADIVISALQPKGKWFPDFYDIDQHCRSETRKRSDILKMLEEFLGQQSKPKMIAGQTVDPIKLRNELQAERDRVLNKFQVLSRGLAEAVDAAKIKQSRLLDAKLDEFRISAGTENSGHSAGM